MNKILHHVIQLAPITVLGASCAGWSPLASATGSSGCIDSLDGTGATFVVDAKGQGNFSCSNMSPGPDGGHMENITHQVQLTLKNHNREVDVRVLMGLPADEIDAVYISKGNGKRCLYSFSNYSELATGLMNGGASFKKSDVTVCADGIGNKPPPEIEPISTVGDGCVGEVTVAIDGVEQTLDNLALVTAVSLDGDTLAVCNGADETLPQVQCVNVCENFESRAETPACADANSTRGLMNGETDLEACRPCDLTDLSAPPGVDQDGNPLFYCWEYTNSVVRDPPLNLTTYPNAPGTEFVPGSIEILRTSGTLLPHKKAWSSADETEVFNGCYTTTRKLNGRLYSYTTCY